MNSIDAMNIEIEYQKEFLTKITLPSPVNPSKCLFIGNGDSYVACMTSVYVSGFKASCCTPMHIILNPKIARDRDIFFVSISGNNVGIIEAAKIMKDNNIYTTLITSNDKSVLVDICDNLIYIPFPRTNVPTSGTISFTASLLTCLALIGRISIKNMPLIYERSKQISTFKEQIFGNSFYVFLGEGILYPSAIYGSLKINEVFGYPSIFYPVDEFAHAPIFSIRPRDYLFLFTRNDHKEHKLIQNIKKINTKMKVINCGNGTIFEAIFTSIFTLQFMVAHQARKKRLTECNFINNKKYLEISSALIYKQG